ncbi:hypothetical protein [Nocardioides rubriscoriae]|uniref:hypothetical protein n=1 Tax=Nocardioides rubriscoriae TaxID=642762 RepID=UPI0011DFAE73|nr:hypothetical protein [Nocardioides rubriscoriae]
MTEPLPERLPEALPERTLVLPAWRRTLVVVGLVVLVVGLLNAWLSDQFVVGRVAGVVLSVYVAWMFLVQAIDPRRRVVLDRTGFGVEHPARASYRVAWAQVERLEVGRGAGTDHVQVHVHDPVALVMATSGSMRGVLERTLRLRGHLTVTSSTPALQVRDLMERYRAAAERPGP